MGVVSQSGINALTGEDFIAFIREHGIREFYVAGADATACIKSTAFNMAKAGYIVHVLSDCITSYDKKELAEYGWEVSKISMKAKTVFFIRVKKACGDTGRTLD